MGIEPIRDEGQTLSNPYGEVIGVVDTKEQFDEAVAALKAAGFEKIQALHGDDGVQLLDRLRGSYFMGDTEEEALNKHLFELKAGHYIVSICAGSERAEEASSIAAAHGARYLIHFGLLVNTRLTP